MERKERVQIIQDAGYEHRQRYVEYALSTRQVIISRLSQLVWLITTVVVILLTFRFFLLLMAANPANGFVDLIYSITDRLVQPFTGIVSTVTSGEGMIVDPAAIFAIVVYTLAASIFITLIRILFADTKRSRHVTTVDREH